MGSTAAERYPLGCNEARVPEKGDKNARIDVTKQVVLRNP